MVDMIRSAVCSPSFCYHPGVPLLLLPPLPIVQAPPLRRRLLGAHLRPPFPHSLLRRLRLSLVAASSVLTCAAFGFLAAVLSGVKIAVGTLRVIVIGIITLGGTYGVGYGFSRLPGV